jgi:hypothetical protein
MLLLLTMPPMLVTTTSTTYAQDSTTCKTQLAEAKKIAAAALTKAEEANADAKAANQLAKDAQAERGDAIKQRDEYRAHLDQTQTERDNLAGQKAALETDNIRLRAENADHVTRTSALEATVDRLRRHRWIWAGVALSFWIRVAYLLRLRGPFVRLQRRLKREHKAPRKPLPKFDSPEHVERYVKKRFKYRLDQTRIGGKMIPLDWVTDPEVFHARLDEGEQKDGDCDDYHAFVAHALKPISGVSDVYLLSSGYKGGGHTTCVYKFKGNWYLFNYSIKLIDDPNDAPRLVAEWGTKGDNEVAVEFYVFETIDPPWRAAALGRRGRVPV